jgi:O-antigen/teichoic acid export membrane protein
LSTLKKLASETAIYGMSTIVGRFLNYLLVPLHTRIFAPGEFGVMTEMYGYVTFFIVVLPFGLETALFRFSRDAEDKVTVYSTALVSIVISSLLFIVAMSAGSSHIAAWIDHPGHGEYITWFAWILGLDAIASIPFAMLRQQSRPLKFAIVKNLNIFTNIILNLYFLMLCPYWLAHHGTYLPGYNPAIGVGYVFLSHLVASAITIPMLLPELAFIRRGADFGLWKRMLMYGLPLVVVGLGGMVNEALDRVIMKYLVSDPADGLRQLGIYGANYKLSILITLFVQAFRFAAEPFFFAQSKSDKKAIYAQVMDWFVLACFGLFLLVTLYLDLFKEFIGHEYHEGLKVVPILLLANVCLGIYYNLSIWYKLADQTGKGALISIGGAVITIVLNLLLVPVYGYVGAAWATLFCYLSMMVAGYIMGRYYYPIPYHISRAGAIAGSALTIYFIHLVLFGNGASWISNFMVAPVLLAAFAGFFVIRLRQHSSSTDRP